MKKYLKCIKKLPLAKSILVGWLFFIFPPLVLGNNTYNVQDYVTNINLDQFPCSFSVGQTQGIKSSNKNICNFAQSAKNGNKKVMVQYQSRLEASYSWDDAASPSLEFLAKSIHFADTDSKWFNGQKNTAEYGYFLEGNVEDVFYNDNGRCYVAITENKYIKNKYDGTFHETNNTNICKLAESAFYLGLKVKMNATVDKTENDYANDISNLNISRFCTKK